LTAFKSTKAPGQYSTGTGGQYSTGANNPGFQMGAARDPISLIWLANCQTRH